MHVTLPRNISLTPLYTSIVDIIKINEIHIIANIVFQGTLFPSSIVHIIMPSYYTQKRNKNAHVYNKNCFKFELIPKVICMQSMEGDYASSVSWFGVHSTV